MKKPRPFSLEPIYVAQQKRLFRGTQKKRSRWYGLWSNMLAFLLLLFVCFIVMKYLL